MIWPALGRLPDFNWLRIPFDLGTSNGFYPTGTGNNGIIGGNAFKAFAHCAKGPHDAGRNETILFGDDPGAINVFNQVPLFQRKPCNSTRRAFYARRVAISPAANGRIRLAPQCMTRIQRSLGGVRGLSARSDSPGPALGCCAVRISSRARRAAVA